MKTALSVTRAICEEYSDVITALKADSLPRERFIALNDRLCRAQSSDHGSTISDTNYQPMEVMIDFLLAIGLDEGNLRDILAHILSNNIDGNKDKFMQGPSLSKAIIIFVVNIANTAKLQSSINDIRRLLKENSVFDYVKIQTLMEEFNRECVTVENVSKLPKYSNPNLTDTEVTAEAKPATEGVEAVVTLSFNELQSEQNIIDFSHEALNGDAPGHNAHIYTTSESSRKSDEDENVRHALEAIRAAHVKNKLSAVNMSGFGHAALSAILVAEEMSKDPELQDIPVHLFLIDPTCGNGSAKLTPNIREAQIILQSSENRSEMNALSWENLEIVNPLRTRVDYTVSPGSHTASTKSENSQTDGATRLATAELHLFHKRHGSPTKTSPKFATAREDSPEITETLSPPDDLTPWGRLALYNYLHFRKAPYEAAAKKAEAMTDGNPARSFLSTLSTNVSNHRYFSGPRHEELFRKILPRTYNYLFSGNSKNYSQRQVKHELKKFKGTKLYASIGNYFSDLGLNVSESTIALNKPHGTPHLVSQIHELQDGEVSEPMLDFIIYTLLTMPSASDAKKTLAEAITQNPTIEDISAIVDLIDASSKSNDVPREVLMVHLLKSIRVYFSAEKWANFCQRGKKLITAEIFAAIEPEESGAASAASGKEEEDDADIKAFLAKIRKQLQHSLIDLLNRNFQLNTTDDVEIAEGGAAAAAAPAPKKSMGLFDRVDNYLKSGAAATAPERIAESTTPKNLLLFRALVSKDDNDQAVIRALEAGADVNARYFSFEKPEHSARTPMMIGIVLGRWGSVGAIVRHHMDSRNAEKITFAYNETTGKSTAIHLLAETKIQALGESALPSYKLIVDICLSEIAADPASKKILLMKNAKGETILDIAIEGGNTVMIDALFKHFHISEIVSPERLTSLRMGPSCAISEFLKGIAPSGTENTASSDAAAAAGNAHGAVSLP